MHYIETICLRCPRIARPRDTGHAMRLLVSMVMTEYLA